MRVILSAKSKAKLLIAFTTLLKNRIGFNHTCNQNKREERFLLSLRPLQKVKAKGVTWLSIY